MLISWRESEKEPQFLLDVLGT